MFEGKSFWQIINMGGATMYVLIACSIVSLAIILERLYSYHQYAVDRLDFMRRVRAEVEKGAIDVATKMCELNRSPVAAVVGAGLGQHGRGEKEIGEAMEREVMVETLALERFTGVVGIIGNVAVYIGLFGTVLGIIRAFHSISLTGQGGLSVVIGGVAEALICTATGLFVAVPAVVAHNYFMRRVDRFVVDMQYCSSQTLALLTGKKP